MATAGLRRDSLNRLVERDEMTRLNSKQQNVRSMKGAGALGALSIVVGIMFLLLLVAVGFFEGRKAYWDYRVKGMCEKDGGTKVFERVAIPPQYVDKDGFIRIPSKPAIPDKPLSFEAKTTDSFYYEAIDTPIVSGYLAVGKHSFNVVRTSDSKILSTMIVYSRSGGDFPTFAHPSSYSCPGAKSRPDPLDATFIK